MYTQTQATEQNETVKTSEQMRYYYFSNDTFTSSDSHHYPENAKGQSVYTAAPILEESEPFLKIVSGNVTVMSENEQAAEKLRFSRRSCSNSIDSWVKQQIEKGFTYNGKTFSLSNAAQQNWNRITALAATNGSPESYTISTENAEEVVLNKADIAAFMVAANSVVETAQAKGREHKAAIASKTDSKGIVQHLILNRIISKTSKDYLK